MIFLHGINHWFSGLKFGRQAAQPLTDGIFVAAVRIGLLKE
jgi:hypothetical protein